MFNCRKLALMLTLLFLFFSISHAKTVVLQNGLDEYNGCVDAHMTSVGGKVFDPAGAEEYLVFQE